MPVVKTCATSKREPTLFPIWVLDSILIFTGQIRQGIKYTTICRIRSRLY